ncbi:MAG: class I SAM-dependent methyltransferase [Clostridia bacterium]|nr:class I SAM-dependent methyltransferase [Clostridia bacterium]
MNTFDYLNSFYNAKDEDARLTSRHGSVEFLTTLRYIERYLAEGSRILEIGAGTGRYSHYFARAGYAVDAVELIPHNIEVFRRNTLPGERITVTEGNACHMPYLADDSYDITLLLGPMYHLYTEEEQHAALSEALRVTKPGGILFTAYCMNDASVIGFCFCRGGITKEPYKSLIDPVTFKCASTPAEIFQLYRIEDVDALMAGFDTERLHLVGTDMATNYIADTVDRMDEETFALYLRYHYYICERADMIGTTYHLLDVVRKRG